MRHYFIQGLTLTTSREYGGTPKVERLVEFTFPYALTHTVKMDWTTAPDLMSPPTIAIWQGDVRLWAEKAATWTGHTVTAAHSNITDYSLTVRIDAISEGVVGTFDIYTDDWPEPSESYSDVTLTVEGEGSTEPPAGSYPSTYPLGSTLYVQASPGPGWVYDHMNRNGQNWTSSNPGEFLNLQASELIEVVFVQSGAAPTPGAGIDPTAIAIGAAASIAALVFGVAIAWPYINP